MNDIDTYPTFTEAVTNAYERSFILGLKYKVWKHPQMGVWVIAATNKVVVIRKRKPSKDVSRLINYIRTNGPIYMNKENKP